MKISFGELTEILGEKLPVYGDFLKYFKIELGLLPITRGTPLLIVGSLYSRLKEMHSGMLFAFIMLALLKNGFVHFYTTEYVREGGKSEEEALESGRKAMGDFIRGSIRGGIDYVADTDIFVNSENPKEAINVTAVCAEISHSEKTQDAWLYDGSADDLIKKLNKEKSVMS